MSMDQRNTAKGRKREAVHELKVKVLSVNAKEVGGTAGDKGEIP
jgi:hypothetical protein